MNELKPLIDYVPELQRSFLTQPLTLGMFVPCDEDGNPTNEPDEAALDRVIIDGFEATHIGIDTVIESLNGVQIRFMGTETIALVRPFPMKVKTISDLCGLGIKLKER